MTPDAIRAAAHELIRRRRAQASLLDYVDYLDTGLKNGSHHVLIARELEALERGEFDRLMICCPPGSAKSSWCSVYFPAWYLGRNPDRNVIAASHTAGLAEMFGRRVRNLVGTPEHRNVFPEMAVASDSSAAGQWEVVSEARQRGGYYAAGVGGSVTGRRGDCLVCDDPVRSREDADSETIREKTWQWYVNDIRTRLKPGAKQIVVMTRWHEDDLGGRILKDEPGRWRVIKLPMIAGANDPLGRAPGEQLWPEWFTADMVRDAQRDPRAWSALYQQEPRPDAGGEFRRNWMCYYDKLDARGMTRIILVDPAGSKKRHGNDYTTMWVIGMGEDDNYYVLDVIRDRLSLTERTEALFRLHRIYKPQQVRYERYSMQADIEHIQVEQARRSYRFQIIEVGGNQVSKEDRIRRLIPVFECGRIWFPETLHYTDHTGQTRDLVQAFVEEELLPFPVAVHDDMTDSLARLVEPGIDTPWPGRRLAAQQVGRMAAFGMLDETIGY